MSLPPEDQLPQDSIGFVLTEVMEYINNIFTQAEVELPGRQYLAIGGSGDTVHDCEQLTVALEQVYSGLPGGQAQTPSKCNEPRTAVLIVELVRCIPTGAQSARNGKSIAPAVDAMNSYALARAKDAWLLMDGLLTAAEDFWFVGGMSDVTSGPPQGGYQAQVATLVVGIP